jgi:hypothetical protein
MKMVMIAALVAAQLSAAAGPAQAAELPREEPATQQPDTLADGRGRTRFEEGAELNLRDEQALALRVGGAPESPRVAAAQKDEPRKRKSTGDKVLTGAAVILGLGALAVGGLLVAIFAN